MIGFIGPADAVAAASTVASSIGLASSFTARSYQDADEAAALTSELEQWCDVVLFAGRVPYRLALRGEPDYRAILQFVPESAVDVYHTLLHLTRVGHGVIPRISVDVVSREFVGEVFTEAGLEPPTSVLPADEISGDWSDITKQLYEFHRRQIDAGEVDVCVTWLRSVHDRLVAAGIPVWRAQHTSATYREALTRSGLSAEARRSRAGQPVVGHLAPDGRTKSLRRAIAESCATELRGTLMPTTATGPTVVYSTRGALEVALAKIRTGRASPFVAEGRLTGAFGFGVGTNLAESNAYAERALSLAVVSNSLCVMRSDGLMEMVDPDESGRVMTLRDSVVDYTSSGLGPLATSQLIESIRLIDAGAVTAPQLARAYGVTERSARRLLGRLERTGAAERLGREGSPGPGRPRVVYKINVDRLVGDIPVGRQDSR